MSALPENTSPENPGTGLALLSGQSVLSLYEDEPEIIEGEYIDQPESQALPDPRAAEKVQAKRKEALAAAKQIKQLAAGSPEEEQVPVEAKAVEEPVVAAEPPVQPVITSTSLSQQPVTGRWYNAPDHSQAYHQHGHRVEGNGNHIGDVHNVTNHYYAAPVPPVQEKTPGQEELGSKDPAGNGPAGNPPEGKDPQADVDPDKPKKPVEELEPPRRNQKEMPQGQGIQFKEFPHLRLISHEQENWAEQAVHAIYEIKAAMEAKVINDLNVLRNFLQNHREKKRIKAFNAKSDHLFTLQAAAYVPQKIAAVKILEDQVGASGLNVHKGNLGKIGGEFVKAAKKAEKLAHKYQNSTSYKKQGKVAEAQEAQIAALHIYEAALKASQSHQR